MAVTFANRNFQKELDRFTDKLQSEGRVPTLLLHSCCAPCSSHCIEYLSDFFKCTVFYYNPNISEQAEYQKRVAEQIRFIEEFPARYPVSFIEGDYEPEKFYACASGYEQCEEGGERCHRCFRLRLGKTAELARDRHFDYFTTTLTISPLKDSVVLNEIGDELSREYGVAYLLSDFKKKEGYKRSIELSREYNLYRQNYCGCEYSKSES